MFNNAVVLITTAQSVLPKPPPNHAPISVENYISYLVPISVSIFLLFIIAGFLIKTMNKKGNNISKVTIKKGTASISVEADTSKEKGMKEYILNESQFKDILILTHRNVSEIKENLTSQTNMDKKEVIKTELRTMSRYYFERIIEVFKEKGYTDTSVIKMFSEYDVSRLIIQDVLANSTLSKSLFSLLDKVITHWQFDGVNITELSVGIDNISKELKNTLSESLERYYKNIIMDSACVDVDDDQQVIIHRIFTSNDIQDIVENKASQLYIREKLDNIFTRFAEIERSYNKEYDNNISQMYESILNDFNKKSEVP